MTFSKTFKNMSATVLTTALVATATPTATLASANPLLGQLEFVGFNFCPRGWSSADGQLLAISQYQALFSLFGTMYGGDGRTTFALPDLRGRAPIGAGTGPGLDSRTQGQRGGTQTTTITVAEMPNHNHFVNVTNATANKKGPGNDYLAASANQEDSVYHDGPFNRTMEPDVISNTGGSQPLNTESPYLVGKWCVAMQGVFPSRN